MNLKSLFRRPGAGTAGASAVSPPAPAPEEPLPPEALEELREAWEELAAAAKETGVINIHACSRYGGQWEKDPAAVRTIAANIRSLPITES